MFFFQDSCLCTLSKLFFFLRFWYNYTIYSLFSFTTSLLSFKFMTYFFIDYYYIHTSVCICMYIPQYNLVHQYNVFVCMSSGLTICCSKTNCTLPCGRLFSPDPRISKLSVITCVGFRPYSLSPEYPLCLFLSLSSSSLGSHFCEICDIASDILKRSNL